MQVKCGTDIIEVERIKKAMLKSERFKTNVFTENEIEDIKDFLYGQIKKVYGIGPNIEFHYDIEGIREYYILPKCNNFFMVFDGEKIIATAAIRAYDKDYELFKGKYTKKDTASIWRLMVDENYRRHGLARKLVTVMEEFAKDAGCMLAGIVSNFSSAMSLLWSPATYDAL